MPLFKTVLVMDSGNLYDDYIHNSVHSMQYDWVQKVADKLNFNEFTTQLSTAITFAHLLCGLFALFYICNIVWKSWANGSQIDLYKCLKPFVIGLCIMNFSLFVSAVDLLTDGIGSVTQQFANVCGSESKEQFSEYASRVMGESSMLTDKKNQSLDDDAEDYKMSPTNYEDSEEAADQKDKQSNESLLGVIAAALNGLKSLPQRIANTLMTNITAGIQCVAVFAASLFSCCILCMGFIGKAVLYIVGPILFAMELIPGMEGRISGWFKKYLTYSLYPCIINIMNGVLMMVMVTLSSGFETTLTGAGVTMLVHIVVGCVGAFMFLSVPSIANQIMETASNSVGAYAMRPVKYAGGKAGNTISSSIGSGASSVAGTATKSTVAGQVANTVNNAASSMGKKMSSGSNYTGK